MFRRITRKRSIAALSAVAVLALAGGAFAYFTSTGSGTGHGAVGTATNFTVNASAVTGGPVYPGAGSESIPYTVTNPGGGAENLSATNAVVASSSGNITQGGVAVPGCLASWFTATDNPPSLPQDLGAGATSTGGSVTVTMSDSGTNQNPCENKTPDITISAS